MAKNRKQESQEPAQLGFTQEQKIWLVESFLVIENLARLQHRFLTMDIGVDVSHSHTVTASKTLMALASEIAKTCEAAARGDGWLSKKSPTNPTLGAVPMNSRDTATESTAENEQDLARPQDEQ